MTATLTELKILTLDCQATGANPDKGHLLEIGWIPTRASAGDNPAPAGLQVYPVRLPAGAAIPRPVERITGITAELTAAGISSKNVWECLIKTAQQITGDNPSAACPVAIHFARFEEPFLRHLHRISCSSDAFPFRIICTHEIAIRLLPNLPRKGIRAIAGYFGHSMPELKRCSDHVIATAFIWKKLVELLDTTCGVSRLDQLIDWLAATRPPGRSKRSYPMNPEIHRRLPNKPGIYRMLRAKKSDPLYIGKAKSLKQRVNSYFRQRTPLAEHTLEMLTQARELDFILTGSALEAALLESDEIKRHSPPYNFALRRRGRGIIFCTKDLCRHSAMAEKNCAVGPLPAGRFLQTLSAFGMWFANGLQLKTDDHLAVASDVLALPPDYAAEIECLREGFEVFREMHSYRLAQQPALRFLTALGARLWRERLQTIALAKTDPDKEHDNVDDDGEENESEKEFVWTPVVVAQAIENMVCHSAQMIRRARWFCLVSESCLAWSSGDRHDDAGMIIVLENGSLVKRNNLRAGEETPIPPGFAKSFHARKKNIDLITYDRLRVLTTELRRLVSEGRDIELRLGPKAILNRRNLMKALRWV